MARPTNPSRPAHGSPSTALGPALVPCLLLKGGEVYLPADDGPTVARSRAGTPFDPFDVVDRLSETYPLVYLVDLDGVERGDPQLDYLQEIARDVAIWVDAGVRTAEQAIDVLVTGARRAVLSSAYLNGPRELRRAWRLSTELVFEVEVRGATLAPVHEGWGTTDPVELTRMARGVGTDHVVVSPRGTEPDWGMVRAIASGGPTWVDGSFRADEASLLRDAGASGGIFHVHDLLDHWDDVPLPDPPNGAARDDET